MHPAIYIVIDTLYIILCIFEFMVLDIFAFSKEILKYEILMLSQNKNQGLDFTYIYMVNIYLYIYMYITYMYLYTHI